MQYTHLGHSAITVSRICLGCMGFGNPQAGQHSWTLDQEHSTSVIAAALEQSINFFDTAIAYQGGTSEVFLGHALRQLACRKDVVIATKFLPRTDQQIQDGVSAQEHIAMTLEASLRHLGTDYVDLYICHMWDYRTPIVDILDGLNRMIVAGKVRAIGISNCHAWQLAKANAMAERLGYAKFVSVQGHHNLIFREEEREMVPLCKAEGIAMTPYSALAAGRLSRLRQSDSVRAQQDSFARLKYASTLEQDDRIIARVARLADQRGVSMTEIALAWLLTKVTAPVVGATCPEQIRVACRAVDVQLSAEEITDLEELYVPHRLVGVMAQNTPDKYAIDLSWQPSEQSRAKNP